MPEIVYDTDAELGTWTASQVVVTGGLWEVAPGFAEGTVTSPVIIATGSAADFTELIVEDISKPVGCMVLAKWRSGDTEGECTGQDWGALEAFNVVFADGSLIVPIFAYMENSPALPRGKYGQARLYLYDE